MPAPNGARPSGPWPAAIIPGPRPGQALLAIERLLPDVHGAGLYERRRMGDSPDLFRALRRSAQTSNA